jgi:ABC-type Fe3+-hydroxamate transport system substrate-binding protein
MQRVRIGLTGLAAVFLLVILAAAFFGLVSDESTVTTDATGNVVTVAPTPPGGNTSQPSAPKEPLAELGVTPGGSPEAIRNDEAPAAPPAR